MLKNWKTQKTRFLHYKTGILFVKIRVSCLNVYFLSSPNPKKWVFNPFFDHFKIPIFHKKWLILIKNDVFTKNQ